MRPQERTRRGVHLARAVGAGENEAVQRGEAKAARGQGERGSREQTLRRQGMRAGLALQRAGAKLWASRRDSGSDRRLAHSEGRG